MNHSSSRPNRRCLLLLLGVAILAITVLAIGCGRRIAHRPKTATGKHIRVTYGVSAYQDTILPIVAKQQGWYAQEGIDADIRVLDWGVIMSALASGSVDVAIQNFNSFQESYPNISERGVPLVFYYPLYVFKGAAIMIPKGSSLKPLSEMLKAYPNDRQAAIRATAAQLRGKTIVTTEGTEMEQVVLAALDKAGLSAKDAKIINAEPEIGLNAFLAGSGDAYSGGVTQRTEANRHGATVLLDAADLTPPVIDGLVTTEKFAKEHPEVLKKLITLWFRTINYMNDDLDSRSKPVIDYLASVGSTRYSVDEYKYTWGNTEVYLRSPAQMEELVLSPGSTYYWKDAWLANNEFLLKTKKIDKAVPFSAFWGEKVQPGLGQ